MLMNKLGALIPVARFSDSNSITYHRPAHVKFQRHTCTSPSVYQSPIFAMILLTVIGLLNGEEQLLSFRLTNLLHPRWSYVNVRTSSQQSLNLCRYHGQDRY